MTDQMETELGAPEGDEFSGLSLDAEIAEALWIAAMDDAAFKQTILPRTITLIDRESGRETIEESASYFGRFERFVSDLGVRYFRPQEFLMLGSSNEPGQACGGRNAYPPDSAWPAMAATARMLDEIRHRLGTPVVIMSGYRAEAYNNCIGGARLSQHRHFSAFDFVARGGAVADWWRVAREVRGSDQAFAGGVGKYSSFVHVDTRGQICDW